MTILEILQHYRGGRVSPEVAVARLLLAGHSPDAVLPVLADQDDALRALIEARRAQLLELRAVFAGVDHARPADPDDAITHIRKLFDRAVLAAPEASVAAYSLGDPAILARATDELVAWLDREHLIGPERDVLDLGCGIGRVATALAPRVRSVLGLDLSPAMIQEAERRGPAPNLRFELTDGEGLALPAASFDLVLAVDSFPYLMQAGQALAERHVRDAARVLRPGGALAILNLSYSSDQAADVVEAEHWAATHGFVASVLGTTPFALWDGRAFVLRRP